MVHPGIILNNLRKGLITQTGLAEKCEVNRSTIARLLIGQMDFTLHLARVIARCGYGTTEQWLNLQKAYDAQRTDEKRIGRPLSKKRN